ncbi:MAG: hypothetical protein JWM47_2175, partial [Acidimicrobiales bacterium]|nr:hypothetical protein [Acidimicrobiales bacterium]
MTDPFDALSTPVEPQTPRPGFARALRTRVVDELGLDPTTALPTVDLSQRSRTMSTTTATPGAGAADATAATALVPYHAVNGGARAHDR